MVRHGDDEPVTDGRFKILSDNLTREITDRVDQRMARIEHTVNGLAALPQALAELTARMNEMMRGDGGNGGNRNGGNGVNNNMRQVKMKLPSFSGSVDADAYLKWESKMEHIFECNNYSDEKKFKLAQLEFTGYAMIWLRQLNFARHCSHEDEISTWTELKREMKDRFVPKSYFREYYQALQTIRQGERSVAAYYQELVMLLAKANIQGTEAKTKSYFLAGLRLDIANRVKAHVCPNLEAMLRAAETHEKLIMDRQESDRQWNEWQEKWKKECELWQQEFELKQQRIQQEFALREKNEVIVRDCEVVMSNEAGDSVVEVTDVPIVEDHVDEIVDVEEASVEELVESSDEHTKVLDTPSEVPDLSLQVVCGEKPVHGFTDPFDVRVDEAPTPYCYDYIAFMPRVIDINLKPLDFSFVALMKNDSFVPRTIVVMSSGHFIFDPGISLLLLVGCLGLICEAAQFYDVLLIRGRILSNREGMM